MGATGILALNENFDFHTNSAYFTNADPDANDIAVGSSPMTNGSGNQMVAYCWHSVPGFSSFGRYTGNYNADGVFLHLGFRPAYFMVRRTNSTANWIIYDSARDTSNVVANNVAANLNTDEDRDETWGVDFLSNGIKLRTFHPYFNGDGGDYVYIAFAENPYNISNAR